MRGIITAITISGLFFAQAATAELQTKDVTYSVNGTELHGYLAYDDQFDGERPAVLVVHEWWGHNDYARKRARMLAELGYIALSVDMYGGGKTADHPKQAGEFAGQVRKNMDKAEARFLAAKELLINHPLSADDDLAAIGYCFGGGIVLEMARRGVDLDGVVSFHGSLGTENPAQRGEVEAKVLVLNGAADPFVKPEAIEQFKQEMRNAGVDYQFINYEGAKHSFTNPQATEFGKKFELPLEYSAEADKASWQAMQDFFAKIFGKD